MARIQTRPSEELLQASKVDRLRGILHDVTTGLIGFKTDKVYAGDSIDEVTDNIERTFEALVLACSDLQNDLRAMTQDNMQLAYRLDEAIETLQGFMAVDYDDPLDHATSDLMDALASSGAAEINYDGSLAWDSRVTMSKSDLKPALRQAIHRWVEQRLQ